MSGKGRSPEPHRPDRLFFLDECLPKQVGDALRLVDFPITTADLEGKCGKGDSHLIPWLAADGCVWITKDDEAKRQHLDQIIKCALSIIWVRGIDRQANKVSPQQLHLMLTNKLLAAKDKLVAAHGPLHFLLYLNGGRPCLEPRDIHGLRQKQKRRQKRLKRR